MITALTMEHGRSQIILTPENDIERTILGLLRAEGNTMSIKTGEFYRCLGGWSRWGSETHNPDSTIIVLEPKPSVTEGN